MSIKLTPATKPTMTSAELDRLLNGYFDNSEVSATNISATKISDTKREKISATKVSDTNYMNNYKREKYDTIRIDFQKGAKEMLKQEASKRGISVTKLIKLALAEYLKQK